MKIRILSFFVFLLLIQISCSNDNGKLKEAENFRTEATRFIESKDHESALNSAQKALEISESVSDKSGMAEALFLLTRTSALSGNFEKAIEYGHKGSPLCQKLEYFELEYKTNNMLSWSYFETGHDFEKVLEHEKRQVFVVNQLKDNASKALVFNNFGYDLTISGTMPLDSVIKYSKFANDHYAGTENHNGRWYTLMNLTWQYRLKNDLETSENYGRLAVEQAKKDNDRHAIIEANTNLGETMCAQGKITEARIFYENALNQSTKEDDRDKYVFDVYYSKYLWLIKAHEEAIWRLEKAVDFLKTGEVFYEMLGRAYLADFYFQIEEYEKAEEQISIIKNPRSDYFAFETKVLAALTEIQLLRMKNETEKAEEIRLEFLNQAQDIGADYLIEKLENI